MKEKILDIVIVGSGLSALNFADSYTDKGKKINIISYSEKSLLNKNASKGLKFLPSQMRGKSNFVKNFFSANNIELENNCKVLGSLEFGGLSNHWGLQMDNYVFNDQKIKNKYLIEIVNQFFIFLKKYKLIGNFFQEKLSYKNDFKIPDHLEFLKEKKKREKFIFKKPILGFFSNKSFKGDLNKINEKKDKLNSVNFFNKIKKNKNINFLNLYVKKILKSKNLIELECINNQNKKVIIYTKKLILAAGTIATTKLITEYLNIKNEIKIKHHPRLFSLFFSRKSIKSKMKFTPSVLQMIHNSKTDCFSADLRPGNKMITESIEEVYPFIKPFKSTINFFNQRMIFSNILLDSKNSDIFMKFKDNKFKIYSKNFKMRNILKKKNKEIFKFLLSKKIILPFFYTFYPGPGADYHYFGSMTFNNKKKLSVNNNCKLKGSNNIFIVDGSIFNFKRNKYPLGIIIANARRVGKYLSKFKS